MTTPPFEFENLPSTLTAGVPVLCLSVRRLTLCWVGVGMARVASLRRIAAAPVLGGGWDGPVSVIGSVFAGFYSGWVGVSVAWCRLFSLGSLASMLGRCGNDG